MTKEVKKYENQLIVDDPEYVRLVSHISELWDNAKAKAAIAINTELLDANWETGRYIVEFEQGGKNKVVRSRRNMATSFLLRFQRT